MLWGRASSLARGFGCCCCEQKTKVEKLLNSHDLSPATVFELSKELAIEPDPKKRERTESEKELKKQHRTRGGLKKRAKTLANELSREGLDMPHWKNHQYSEWRSKQPDKSSFSRVKPTSTAQASNSSKGEADIYCTGIEFFRNVIHTVGRTESDCR